MSIALVPPKPGSILGRSIFTGLTRIIDLDVRLGALEALSTHFKEY